MCLAGSMSDDDGSSKPSQGKVDEWSLIQMAGRMEIISIHDISLAKFLGSGGYGEVCFLQGSILVMTSSLLSCCYLLHICVCVRILPRHVHRVMTWLFHVVVSTVLRLVMKQDTHAGQLTTLATPGFTTAYCKEGRGGEAPKQGAVRCRCTSASGTAARWPSSA